MILAGCALLLLQSSVVQAQWATNGTNINNTNSGNVGIGTTSPASPLDVSNNQNAVVKLIRVNNPSTGNAAQATFSFFEGSTEKVKLAVSGSGAPSYIGGANAFQIWNFLNSPIVFGTSGAERMRIDGSGKLGIGTAAPGYSLDVQASAQWVARFKKTDATNGGIIVDSATGWNPNLALAVNGTIKWYMNNNVTAPIADSLQFWESTGAYARLTITQAGNVGVGIAAPVYSLDVNGGTNGFRAKAASSSSNDTIATFESASGIQAIVRANGYVGLGTTSPTAKLHVVGNGYLTGNLTIDGNIAAKYQDVAEWVQSSQQLSAGTVVVLDHTKSNQVIASSQAYDTRVAGVISLQPGITLGENGAGKVLVATTGRVKVKVDATAGPIQVGDLLVTSDKEGIAKKSEPLNLGGVAIHRPGTLIGKALEPLDKGTGEILVLLSLQ
jgi:hypothetical protein